MIILFMTVDETSKVMEAGYTHIRVYSDTSATGDFTTLEGTVTLVQETESYSFTDLDGTASTWYKTCYYGSVPDEGSKSEARKGSTSKAYATVKELRNQIGITGTGDDVELAALLDAATEAIDNFCNRPDGFQADTVDSARYYTGSGETTQRIDECVSITTVAVKDSPGDSDYTDWDTPTTALAGDGDWIPYRGDKDNAEFNSLPYDHLMIDPNGDYGAFTSGRFTGRRGFKPTSVVSRGVPTVKVTAKWGYSAAVPYAIKQACIIVASRAYKRGQSAWADTIANPEMGELQYRMSVDPDVKFMLWRYRRAAVG